MPTLDMHHEPIRLPAWAVGILLVIGPPIAAVLLGADWREATATAILGLVAGGGVIGAAESRRARTDSPATIDARQAESARLLAEHDDALARAWAQPQDEHP